MVNENEKQSVEMMNTAKKLLNGKDDLTNDNVKQVLSSMMSIIEGQSNEIQFLKGELLSCKKQMVENTNDIHDLAMRTLELERYSRKTPASSRMLKLTLMQLPRYCQL